MCEIKEICVVLFLLILTVFDWKYRELPLVCLFLFSFVVLAFWFCREPPFSWSMFSGAFIGGVFFIISKCTNQSVGYGDSWVILLLGIFMGGMQVLQLLLSASLMAGICAVLFLWKRQWKRKTTLPFIPFLTLAYIGVMWI